VFYFGELFGVFGIQETVSAYWIQLFKMCFSKWGI